MTNKEAYQAFCAAQSDFPVFMQPWYLDAVCTPAAWDTAIARKGDQIVGVWPYFLKKRFGFRYVAMPVLLRQCGPFIAAKWQADKHYYAIMEDLASQLPAAKAWSQDIPYGIRNGLPLHWAGFEIKQRYSFALDLAKSASQLHEGLSADYRNRVIPSASEAYEIVQELDLETFLRIHRMSYERQDVEVPASDDYIHRLDSTLTTHQSRHILGVRHKATGEIHSAAYLIYDRQSTYLLMAGDDPAYRKSGCGIFLLWHTVLFTQNSLKLQTFDFCGSMIKGIASVRRQFGAEIKPYYRIERDTKLVRFIRD